VLLEKVGIYKRNGIPIRNNGMGWVGFSRMEHSQSKGIKPKTRGHRLRNGVYWHGA